MVRGRSDRSLIWRLILGMTLGLILEVIFRLLGKFSKLSEEYLRRLANVKFPQKKVREIPKTTTAKTT